MKRDMELIREILLEIENNNDPMQWAHVQIPGRTEIEISYHIKLLHEKGWIEATDCSSSDGIDWKAKDLTYDGQEFLSSIKSNTVWNKAKERVISTTGSLTLEGLKIAVPLIVQSLIKQG
jgi:hypothetical protein